MAKPFDPRKILKHIGNSLLREFFVGYRGELEDVPWEELTEHKIDPIFEGWQALPEPQKIEVQMILRDVNELADHRGMAVLAEEIARRCPERAQEFQALASKADCAMWAFLQMREGFEEAAMFARADALAAGRYWKRRNSLPKTSLTVDRATINGLGEALTSFYGPAQMRGRHCHVSHYRRGDNADYFFAYLDDYPDKRLVFNGDGDQPVIRSDRYAFENVFVYDGNDGAMEVYAPGGKKVWEPLQVAFCKAVLGEEVDPTAPLRESFSLDHLLRPDLPLATDPQDGVEEARITRLRITPSGRIGHIEIKADAKGDPNGIYRLIERWIKPAVITSPDTRVLQATFHLKFRHDGRGRQPTMTFDVSVPNACNLKSKPDNYRLVGERCLKLWGIVVNDK